MPENYFTLNSDAGSLTLSLRDNWTFQNVPALQQALAEVDYDNVDQVTFQCGGLQTIDIAGAWVLFRKSQQLEGHGALTEFQGFKAAHFKYLKNITELSSHEQEADFAETPVRTGFLNDRVEQIGRASVSVIEDVGHIARAILEGVRSPSRLAFHEMLRQVDQTGAKAIPVVCVISFLMGVILAYQGSSQLQQFGATIYVVDLVSISVLREMGVLLAAIMVAGRSGSAFAAALGVMKLNEEIDALRVMGLNPNQVLVLPRILGLLIALPLLTIFADFAGLAGGALISATMLDISFLQFTERVASSTNMQDFMVGFAKAPVFALLIAAVGTLRGMQVTSSAEQLGRYTTMAVVQSILLIVVADAFFTMLFSKMGI
jgi:phospholipid/cholesterol/gamma-HCH transport system permease protein